MEFVDGLSTCSNARPPALLGESVDVSKRDVPEQWAELLVQAGFVDPRNGRPSMTKLGEESGVHPSTISALMYGDRAAKSDTVDAIANALAKGMRADSPGDVRYRVRKLMGVTPGDREPFKPHPDADLLSPTERQTINDLIGMLALPKKRKDVMGNAEHPAPTNEVPAADSAAGTVAFLLRVLAAIEAGGEDLPADIKRARADIVHHSPMTFSSYSVTAEAEQTLREYVESKLPDPDAGGGDVRLGVVIGQGNLDEDLDALPDESDDPRPIRGGRDLPAAARRTDR